MLSRPQKRVVLGAALFVIFVLIVVPFIHIEKYSGYVANSLGQSLGRNVTISSVELKTFPVPGLLMHGVEIADDPSISAEPMLRDDSEDGVLATLRISSLWRGRLEIATLKLNYPSVNLVRSADGRWNIESILERVRQTPAAPTVNKRPESRPRFPYIEVNNGRINLKIGQEKKVFALGEADLALWSPAENEWRMRLEAKPIRTDANLSDTGTIKLEGSWKRAAQLRETPVNFKFWWDDGQLGQLTRLVYGSDRGWRGGVRVSGLVLGTPENLKIVTDARLDDFRRYDIATGESLILQTHCDAFYNLSQRLFHDLYCQSPLGGGTALLRGSLASAPDNHSLDLSLTAENVSAQFLATLARHMKKSLPEDISATGAMSASLAVNASADGERTWTGDGKLSASQIRSSVLEKPLVIEASNWRLIGPGTNQFKAPSTKVKKNAVQPTIPQPDSPAFSFDPIAIPAGGVSPATLRGWFSRRNFHAELKGSAEIDRLFQIARLAGLPTTGSDLSGTANGSVTLTGEWNNFTPSDYLADAQLQNITAKISGVASPLSIRSAHFAADANSASLTKATTVIPGLHSDITFNSTWPKHCDTKASPESCSMRFEVAADQLSVDELNSLLNPKAQKQPWYAAIANTVMGSNRKSFPEIDATGSVTIGKLVLKGVPAQKVTANLAITPQGFSLTGIKAEVFGGKYTGQLSSDFRGGTPVYESKGKLQGIAFNNISALMKDDWASGKVNITYSGKAAGWKSDELLSSAAGTANFEWRDGTFRHIELDSPGKPLQFRAFTGAMELKDATLTLAESKLQAQKGIYQVSGTASLERELKLTLARDGAPSFSVSGPLEKPRVAPVKQPQTQADLK